MSRFCLATGRHRAPPGTGALAWAQLMRLVLPVACPGCGLPDEPLCRPCLLALPRAAFLVPDLVATGAPPAWAAGDYASVVQRVLLAFKDDGRHDLLPVLAASLERSARRALRDLGWAGDGGGRPLAVVPVPSSARAVRQRGADLTAALARGTATRLRRQGVAALTVPALRQRRGVRDQAGLSVSERADNLTGGLRLRRGCDVSDLDVLVVDDIVTTGATLTAASATLGSAGACVLGAAVVAATPRHHPATR
ncbi:MAG: ComF family protein [Actinomycetes bacterium]